ncbi:MAG: bifunctional hydroxymethylpyrimidine kinase/phosphomethylpyrimidine kinase [Pyrinomonadaceae bacterium]
MSKSKIQNPNSKIPKVCLTIAGLDPSGGAGIIADIKTFAAFGCYGAAAISSVTFQNTNGVFGAVHQTAESVRRQVDPVLQDFSVSATKTGMLPTVEIITEVARLIGEFALKNVVVDPVVRSTSGFNLIDDAALDALIENLFPVAGIVTPNLPEAERIARMRILTRRDIEKARRLMQSMGAKNVLIKGGHLPIADRGSGNADSGKRSAVDYLFTGSQSELFESEFIETTSTHGTGCTLSAAIAANLALGNNLSHSVRIAKDYVTEAIRTAPGIGSGNGPVNHFVRK